MTKEEFLNLEIGKTFTVGNIKLKVKKETGVCEGCFFKGVSIIREKVLCHYVTEWIGKTEKIKFL